MNQTNWYVFYTKPRSEGKALAELSYKYEEVFLPKRTEIRQWKDRKKKLELPLFPSYLFVKINANEIHYVQSSFYVVRAIKFGSKYAVLSDLEIDGVKKLTNSGANISVFNDLMVGDLVKIVEGPLMGLNGVLIQQKNQCRFALNLLNITQSLTIDVDMNCLQKLHAIT